MDFIKSYFGKNEGGTKGFNWSEVHFYRSTSYKIHTLVLMYTYCMYLIGKGIDMKDIRITPKKTCPHFETRDKFFQTIF